MLPTAAQDNPPELSLFFFVNLQRGIEQNLESDECVERRAHSCDMFG